MDECVNERMHTHIHICIHNLQIRAWATQKNQAGGGLETHVLEHSNLGQDAPKTYKLGTICPSNIQRSVDLSVTKLVKTRVVDRFTWMVKIVFEPSTGKRPENITKTHKPAVRKCTFRSKGTVDLWSTLLPERPLKCDPPPNTARYYLLCKIVKALTERPYQNTTTSQCKHTRLTKPCRCNTYLFRQNVRTYPNMLGCDSWFISWTSFSMFGRFDRSKFIFRTITWPVVRCVTCNNKSV